MTQNRFKHCKWRVFDRGEFDGCDLPNACDDYCDDEMYESCPDYIPKEETK